VLSTLFLEPLKALAIAAAVFEAAEHRLDAELRDPIELDAAEFADLVAFVRGGWTSGRREEPSARSCPNRCRSGSPVLQFQGCRQRL